MKSKTINNNELKLKDVGKNVTLYGWVANKRRFGELTFIDLRDRYGITQCVFNQDVNFSKEACISITGKVVKRKVANPSLDTGKIEVLVKNFEVFSDSEVLPFPIRDDVELKEDTRLKNRFLDLRRPKMQKNIILKNDFIFAIRTFMHQNGFLDIETPMLAKSTPEGARDYLVPTRNFNEFFALPQSPQLFKQLLMASGFEKYFQFARCFRDEDGRKDRQPEFTQLDIETSFWTVEDFQKYIEKMFKFAFEKIGIKIKTPFLRMKYDDSMRDYGNDKPDIRFGYLLKDIDHCFKDSNFEIIKKAPSIRILKIDEIIDKKTFNHLEEIALKNKANILFYFVYENKEVKISNFANKIPNELNLILKEYNYSDGSYFIVANKYENACQALGSIRNELNNIYHFANDQEYKFLWITDWPMFEYDEETKKWSAAHHPFTQFDHKNEEIDQLQMKDIKAKSYDLVLNGFELGSGSARIFDKKIQEKMFNLIGMTKQEQESKFGFFLKAFDYGLPPHCGIGLGIDRLIMILTKQETIRDVIPFPKNAKGQDVFTNAPSSVTKEQLDDLFLCIKEK